MRTGADILLAHVNAAVSDTVRDGIRTDAPETTWFADAQEAVAYGAGCALAGQVTTIWLDTWDVDGVAEQLRAAMERSLPLVVVLTSPVARSGDTAPMLGVGFPVLTPATAQEVIDFTIVAGTVAHTLRGPVLVLADGRRTIWTTSPVVDPVSGSAASEELVQAWSDTSHPHGLGLPLPPTLRLKQQVGRYATESSQTRSVIQSAFENFSTASGRSWSLLRPPTTPLKATDTAFVAQGSTAETAWSLACIRPFPTREIQDALGSARVIGVLDAGLQSDPDAQSLLHQVRAALVPLPVSTPHRRLWKRDSPDTVRSVVPVLHPAHETPGIVQLQSAARTMSHMAEPGPVVVGTTLTAPDIRIPDVEWTVQRMKAEGVDLSVFESPAAGPDEPYLLLLGPTAREVWLGMEQAVGILGSEAYTGRFHSLTDGAGSPVLGRVDGPFDRHVAWTTSTDLLDTPEARAALAPGTTLLVPTEPDVWPVWMADHGLSWAAGELPNLLSEHHAIPVPASSGTSAPETAAPPEVSDLNDADLDRFWHMWGYLYRNGRLSDGPVDTTLLRGSAPGSTGSMLTHATRPGRLPHLIPERCTACAACWTVCPEAAIVARVFQFEDAIASAMPAGALHLPRFKAALAKQAQRLVRDDGLWHFLTVGDALTEAVARLAEKAGLDDATREALESEVTHVASAIGAIRIARNVDDATGPVTGIAVDPDACTACGICIQTCPEQALERSDAWDAVAAWRALTPLPESAAEQEHASRLVGTPSGRMSRSGSADRGNLNRTALRLLLESAHTTAQDRYGALRAQIQDVKDSLEPAMRAILADGTDLNAFERSARTLTVNEPAAARLDALRSIAKKLEAISFEDRPHVLLLDASRRRSLGLAGWPVNPFSMPYVSCTPAEVPGLVRGLRDGLRRTFTTVAHVIRTAEQLRDDVMENDAVTDADRAAAESMLPVIVVVADTPVTAGAGTRVLVLTGAGPGEPAPMLGLHDPLAVLDAFDNAGPAPMTVYAPDPARDGFDTEEAISVARLAFRSGVVPGRNGPPDASAADWMLLQNRFTHHFTPIARRDWQPDQVPVLTWLGSPDDRKPYVTRGTDRYLMDGVTSAFSRTVWNSIGQSGSTHEDSDVLTLEEINTPETEPVATIAPDALETLRANLMRMARLDTLEDAS